MRRLKTSHCKCRALFTRKAPTKIVRRFALGRFWLYTSSYCFFHRPSKFCEVSVEDTFNYVFKHLKCLQNSITVIISFSNRFFLFQRKRCFVSLNSVWKMHFTVYPMIAHLYPRQWKRYKLLQLPVFSWDRGPIGNWILWLDGSEWRNPTLLEPLWRLVEQRCEW